jgi:hypothetical protein
MTREEQELLEAHLDEAVEVSFASGEWTLIRPVIVVDEPPTPDLFYLELDEAGEALGMAGKSVLLEEILGVRLPGLISE